MTEAIKKYNNLTQRIITGILGAAAIITAVCLGPWWYYFVLMLICFFTLVEFYRLAGADGILPERIPGLLTGAFIFTVSFLVQMTLLDAAWYLAIFPLLALVFIVKLFRKNEKKPFTNIAFTFLGIVYVVVPLSLLNVAVFDGGNYHFDITLGILLILWASDTGAYFAGTYFGKRKLFRRISPKKTWEGFGGGALLALAFALGMASFTGSLSVTQWYIVAAIIIVAGTFGDLVESMLKRSIEIKDSGNVLPGHGGFLDRFDALLIAAPFLAVYLEFAMR